MLGSYYKPTLLLVFIIVQAISATNYEAPILDIDPKSTGYVGKISEHSIIVDMTPHLQIKNIESINGICSYHVFKPNSEEFPFTVEIKDKLTGEAMIELIRKELADLSKSNEAAGSNSHARRSVKSILLDCNKRKEFDFLIQAHDCSMPSLFSNKVPVRIEVVDSDDYELEFEQTEYHTSLVKSAESTYTNFMSIRAKDHDCTNNGQACSYSIVPNANSQQELPFQINNEGQISTKLPLTETRMYDFKVRAFDCVNPASYVETTVYIDVVEPCLPKWISYPHEIVSTHASTNLFEQISAVSCQQQAIGDKNQKCDIDSASTKLELVLDAQLNKNNCEVPTECNVNELAPGGEETIVIFSGASVDQRSDDSIEDDYYDANRIENQLDPLQPPLSYRSFSKLIENAQKIAFDGKFDTQFTLGMWLRRPANADQNIKEQVFCGSDSQAMNRHHFGLYFYRGSVKFLMRKENSPQNEHDVFYPSLWEWSLPSHILTGNAWHFYEVKLDYPKAELFIDGVHFVENKTNSDIVDAYELADSDNTGQVTTYVGACYHARTNSLVDHFEGDVGSIVLTKNQHRHQDSNSQCKPKCHESIEMNMVGNENLINSVEQISSTEIRIHTANLDEMSQILRRINYINGVPFPVEQASRKIKVTTSVHCASTGKQISLNEVTADIVLKRQRHEYNVQLEGDITEFVSRSELANGVEPFREISIFSFEINRVDQDSNEKPASVFLSQCQIRITPERNTMNPGQNYEKVMFLQNLLDEFKFEFKETLDSVVISGVQTIENYERFIRRLTYVITNVNEIEGGHFIKDKEFFVSCMRSEPNIETNTIVVKLNIDESKESTEKVEHIANRFGFNNPLHRAQAQRLVVNRDQVSVNGLDIARGYGYKATQANPLVVLVVAMCVCAMGFILIFGAIRMNSAFFGNKRRQVPNEENPNMEGGLEWDDSGLNITENPLDVLDGNKKSLEERHVNEYDYDEEYSSNDEDEEEYDQYEVQYSSEEENGPQMDRAGLEWDDDIGIKSCGNKSQLHSDSLNKFV